MDSDTEEIVNLPDVTYTYEDDSNVYIPNLKPIPVTDLHLCCGVGINSNLDSPPKIISSHPNTSTPIPMSISASWSAVSSLSPFYRSESLSSALI
eukprot:1076728_1